MKDNLTADPKDRYSREMDQKKSTQPCPKCGYPIGIRAGSKEAICKNCGYKDPCCD